MKIQLAKYQALSCTSLYLSIYLIIISQVADPVVVNLKLYFDESKLILSVNTNDVLGGISILLYKI